MGAWRAEVSACASAVLTDGAVEEAAGGQHSPETTAVAHSTACYTTVWNSIMLALAI